MVLPDTEIITLNQPSNRKFVVISKVSFESWKNHLQGRLVLRKPNDPLAYIVEEIQDAKWVDIDSEKKSDGVKESQAEEKSTEKMSEKM
jgi:hypothetical protein